MARGRWDLLARSEHAHAPPERVLALGGGAGAARSLSQTEISLTASPCSERRRCKVGEHRLRAASSWEKYAGPVCVCVWGGLFSAQRSHIIPSPDLLDSGSFVLPSWGAKNATSGMFAEAK